MTELQKLHLRWHNKTGEDMPLSIARLSLDKIRRAVELTEQGVTVGVSYGAVPMLEKPESSMREWDHSDETKIGS